MADYVKSKAFKLRLLITFGFTIVMGVTLLFMLHPVLRREYQHGVWYILIILSANKPGLLCQGYFYSTRQ